MSGHDCNGGVVGGCNQVEAEPQLVGEETDRLGEGLTGEDDLSVRHLGQVTEAPTSEPISQVSRQAALPSATWRAMVRSLDFSVKYASA